MVDFIISNKFLKSEDKKNNIMSKIKNLILVGGGGHSLSCYEIFLSQNISIKGVIDIDPRNELTKIGVSYLGDDTKINNLISEHNHFFISLGGIKNLEKRKTLFEIILRCGGKLINCISKNAVISKSATLGLGITCLHNCIINSNAKIGDNVIINNGAIIEHETWIKQHTHIAPSAIILSRVIVGELSFVGSNATIRQGLQLKNQSFINAGVFLNS